MKKELSPTHEMVACDVCGRTILKGERTEPYLVPDGSRRRVCDLCTRRAEGAGWLRESLHGDLPTAMPRTEPRRSLLGRLRRRLTENGPAAPAPAEEPEPYRAYGREEPPAGEWRAEEPAYRPDDAAEDPPRDQPHHRGYEHRVPAAYSGEPAPIEEEEGATERRMAEQARLVEESPAVEEPGAVEGARAVEGTEATEEAQVTGEPPPLEEHGPLAEPSPEEVSLDEELFKDPREERRGRRYRRRLRDPRHVRAVPTNADAKVERALELFNLSEHCRTVGGLVRTLGQPWVTALPSLDSTSEVTIVVAWELSWYQYRVDLAETDEPVALVDKGHEIHEIDAELRRWNAAADEDGALEPGQPPA